MPIKLTHSSSEFPIMVTEEEYETLRQQKKNGWSNCSTRKEWLVKLHYLRSGFKNGKINRESFFNKEKDLVINWWLKY